MMWRSPRGEPPGVVAQLRQELEEQGSELQEWRIRAQRSEAEVRALKRQMRHNPAAEPSAASKPKAPAWSDNSSLRGSPGDARSPATASASSWAPPPLAKGASPVRPTASWQPHPGTASPPWPPGAMRDGGILKSASEVTASILRGGGATDSPAGLDEGAAEGGASASPQEEVESLRQQLKQRSQALLQLQSDMVRKHGQIDRQRKEVEKQNSLFREELLEMTERAKSLSEQVKSSRKKASELQAAREEVAKLGADREECEARLESAEQALAAAAATRVAGEGSRDETLAALSQTAALREEVELYSSELQARHIAPQADAQDDIQHQLQAYRLAADAAREEMMTEHCEELDDLVRRHDVERRELHHEIRDLKEVAGVVSRPMSELREHFDGQVALMKRELVAQLSDLQERQREQRVASEQELDHLRQSLERCQQDLAASQDEFAVLSTVFDAERREALQLQQRHRLLELRFEEAIVEASERERTAAAADVKMLQAEPPPDGSEQQRLGSAGLPVSAEGVVPVAAAASPVSAGSGPPSVVGSSGVVAATAVAAVQPSVASASMPAVAVVPVAVTGTLVGSGSSGRPERNPPYDLLGGSSAGSDRVVALTAPSPPSTATTATTVVVTELPVATVVAARPIEVPITLASAVEAGIAMPLDASSAAVTIAGSTPTVALAVPPAATVVAATTAPAVRPAARGLAMRPGAPEAGGS